MLQTTPIQIFISTGEVSGDLQGSMLIEALFRQAKKAGISIEIVALGGERMATAGAVLLGNTTKIGSVGILESIPYIIPTYLMQKKVQQYLKNNPPNLIILIDYMGPNLGLGNFVKNHLPQVPILYYIAPQEWVSKRRSKIASPLVPHPKTVWPPAMNSRASARPKPRVTPVITIFIQNDLRRFHAPTEPRHSSAFAARPPRVLPIGTASPCGELHNQGPPRASWGEP